MPVERIYLDHAATTPVHPDVLQAMLPYFSERFGNASSVAWFGREASYALEKARERIAKVLGCLPSEIIFTSCASESDNLAIKGVAQAAKAGCNHIITSPIEHEAVLHTCQYLEQHGYTVTYVPVDRHGKIDPADVEAAMTDHTAIISIMYANNEVGTIQPIAEIGAIARKHGVPLHTDAVQAAGALDLNVRRLQVDLLALSAHKFGAPKGVGLLYVRSGIPLAPQQHGGSQERHRRAGTENVPSIVGMATALELASSRRDEYRSHTMALRDELIAGVLETVAGSELNGHPVERLPNNASFRISGVESEAVLLNLDMQGIAASSGSACTSASMEPSHVLTAMGIPADLAHGALRMTFGTSNTQAHVARVLEVLPKTVEKARKLRAGTSVA